MNFQGLLASWLLPQDRTTSTGCQLVGPALHRSGRRARTGGRGRPHRHGCTDV